MPARPLEKNHVVSRTDTAACGPQKGLAESDSAASNDWALRPVNSTMCDGRTPGRHEWVSTMCALRKTMERTETDGTHNEPQASLPTPFGGSIPPTRGAHCRPLDPRLASLRSGVVMILKNPEMRALTQRRLWVSPSMDHFSSSPVFKVFLSGYNGSAWRHGVGLCWRATQQGITRSGRVNDPQGSRL